MPPPGFDWPQMLLLLLIIGPLVLPYILGPLLIGRALTQPLTLALESLDEPPEFARDFMDAAAADLAPLDFECVGIVSMSTNVMGQVVAGAVWVHPGRRESVQVTVVDTPKPRRLITTAVSFFADFPDGTSIATSNASVGSCFPRNPICDSVRCAGVMDVQMLWDFHRARVDRDAAGRTASLEMTPDAPTRIQRDHMRLYEWLIQCGYVRINEAKDEYVPTVKGRCLAVWRMLAPAKQSIEGKLARHTDATLRELGFGGLVQFRRDAKQRARARAKAIAAPARQQ